MNKAYLVGVSIINPIKQNRNIEVLDISELSICNEMNEHGIMDLTGVINLDDKTTLNKIRKNQNYMFIKATMAMGDVGILNNEQLTNKRAKDKEVASTLFYGVISTFNIKKYHLDATRYQITMTCHSISKLFDMVEDCSAFTNTENSLWEITRNIPLCMTNINYNFWGTDVSLLQENKSIINSDGFKIPMKRLNICYKETLWEFLKRMCSRYGGALFNNIDKNTFLSTFCLSTDYMDNYITQHPTVINTLDTSVSSIVSYGTYTNEEVYKTASRLPSIYKEVFLKLKGVLQAGQFVKLSDGLIGSHSFLKDVKFFIYRVDIKLNPNGAELDSLLHCKQSNALYTAPYNNHKIRGVTLFGSVLEQRSKGVVVSFGERFSQRDGAPYYPLKQSVTDLEYQQEKTKMYNKLYKWAAYLSCGYTDSDELYKKGRRDAPSLMFKDEPSRYAHVAKSLAYNSFKTKYSQYLNFQDEAVTPTSATIPFHTVTYGSGNNKLQGAAYLPVVADIVKVFFPTDDENEAISMAVPHMFEPSVAAQTNSIRESSVDLPDPRNPINDPLSPNADQSTSDGSSLASNLSSHSKHVKDNGDDQTFPPMGYYGDPKNPHLTNYNDYEKNYLQHKEATIIDRRGLLAGLKKDTMKITNISDFDQDNESEYASIHFGGDKGNFLARSSNEIIIEAKKKLTILSKEVCLVAGEKLTLQQKSSHKELLFQEKDITYTTPSADFKDS